MSKKHERPLFVGDIFREGQAPEAALHDIASEVQAMKTGDEPTREMAADVSEANEVLRRISVGVLKRLGTLGAEEAADVAIRLDEMYDQCDRPLNSDLSSVASSYDEELRQPDNIERQGELRGLMAFSHAASEIVAVETVTRIKQDEGLSERTQLLPDAIEAVQKAETVIEPESYQALTVLIDELRAGKSII